MHSSVCVILLVGPLSSVAFVNSHGEVAVPDIKPIGQVIRSDSILYGQELAHCGL